MLLDISFKIHYVLRRRLANKTAFACILRTRQLIKISAYLSVSFPKIKAFPGICSTYQKQRSSLPAVPIKEGLQLM